jgi:diguanylate cyclase (GGDEF)-like protein
MQLDPLTLLVAEAVGSFMSFAVLWQASSTTVKDAQSLRAGALSMLSLVVSATLLASRGVAPAVVYIAAANVSVITCGLFGAHTFAVFNGRSRFSRVVLFIWALACLSFLFVFTLGDYEHHYRTRATITTLGLASLFSIAVAELMRDGNLRREPSRGFMLVLLGLAVVCLFARVAVLQLVPPSTGHLLSPGLERSLGLLPGVIVGTGFGMALLLMHHGRLTAEALDLAARDPLTRLPNRRALVSLLQSRLPRASTAGKHTALLLLDIDHFKRINDTFGHQSGDAVLCRFAECVQELLRPDDFLARIGGEEFCVVLADSDTDLAIAMADRLCAAIASHRCELGDGQILQVTVSIGVTSTEGVAAPNWDTLHVRADEALYAAKSRGRNRAVIWKAAT